MRQGDVTDRELWASVAEDDAGAFAQLFDRYGTTIYAYCFRRTGDWAAAEDLMSLVFLEAWRKRASVELFNDSVLPWLYGVASNLLRNHRRALKRFREALEELSVTASEPRLVDDLAERLDDERHMRTILRDIGGLPRADQEVFALCIWQEMSMAEAAAALGLPERTVRTRLFRARSRLRALQKRREGSSSEARRNAL
jgi:RNA polymerase sigma factor (sigma-70 family)